jgi:hypothetical protein
MFSRKCFLYVGLVFAWAALSGAGLAQTKAETAKNEFIKRVGKYAVELRMPVDGLFAEEEVDVEFRVMDMSDEDPVQGGAPVVKATVTAQTTMPSMPSMPKQKPSTHTEAVPGDYGVIVYFPHGGEYQIDLTITPPGEKAFTVSFRVPVQDAGDPKKRKPKPKPFTLTLTANPRAPKVGEPVELTLTIKNRATGKVVKDFDIAHEQLMHLIVVSKDLSQFAHEHPELQSDGRFTIRYTFPTGGEYRLFADVAPKGAGSQVLMQPLKVSGTAPDVSEWKPVTTLEAVGGVQANLKNSASNLPARRSITLTFDLKASGAGGAVTDLQPWLGAMGHLILIHRDGTTFVHSHPDETDATNGKNGKLDFLARLPKPGIYRGWLQFQRGGQVWTAPFTVAAREEGLK